MVFEKLSCFFPTHIVVMVPEFNVKKSSKGEKLVTKKFLFFGRDSVNGHFVFGAQLSGEFQDEYRIDPCL